MKVGRGRLVNKPSRTGGKLYNKYFIYVPIHVVRDRDFPFKKGEVLVIKIEDSKLSVEKEYRS